MKPSPGPLSREQFQLLKVLSARGALHAPVLLTSAEVGQLLGVSQQGASNYLKELTARGLLRRSLRDRKQSLEVTPAGAEVLRGELAELRRIVEGVGPLQLRGSVVSGLGEGRYYLTVPGYLRQFRAKLGYTPFPGTLNVKLGGEDLRHLPETAGLAGIRIDGFQEQGRTFGGASCIPSLLAGHPCHLVLPDRTHYVDVAEFIAPVELRKALRLKDHDPVAMEVGSSAPPRAKGAR